jgi:branched-chain amino acid transport system substrate-binding protein
MYIPDLLRTRNAFGPLVCVVFILFLAASAADAERRDALLPIRIGVSNVQSGPSRFLGSELIEGSQAYFDLINANGGIYGHRIEIALKDDRYEPDPAVSNTNAFISKDNVLFLFDYVGTPTLTRILPLLEYYQDQHIVNIAPFTGAQPQRKPPYNRYVFNIRASYLDEARCLVDRLYGGGCRHIGLLEQADAYGKSGEVAVKIALAHHKLSLSSVATYRRNQAFDMTMEKQVGMLRSEKVDAVIAFGVYEPCAAFVRDARMTNWNVPIANVSFVGADQLLDTLKTASHAANRDLTRNLINSQVVPSPYDASCPVVKAYRARIGLESAGFISLEGWINAVVVVEALRRAGPNATRLGFVHALESLHGWDPGLGIPLAFSPTCHEGMHRVWLTRSEGGKWVSESVGSKP